MRKKEWQSLHDELKALNSEFVAKLEAKQEIKSKKKIAEIDKGLAYIMELTFSRITTNKKAYELLVNDLRHDEGLVAVKLMKFTDVAHFSQTLCDYISKVEAKAYIER